VGGLTRLKERFLITTLSNGNVSLLTNMAKRAGLPWDCVISAELFGHYKPDPEAYLGCAYLLDVRPEELMLVAAHPGDLRAAQASGLMTAFVDRPQEYGPNQRPHGWTTANSISQQRIFSTSPSSLVPEYAA
jgi:2-haloacid dehalogenase